MDLPNQSSNLAPKSARSPDHYVRYGSSVHFDNAAEEQASQNTLGVYEYWRLLRRHRGLLVICCFAGVLLGILFTLPQTPQFSARAELEIQEVNNNFLNVKSVSPVSEGDEDSLNVLTDVQTQIKIIQSEQLIGRVIAKLRTEHKLAPMLQTTGRVADLLKAFNMPAPKVEPDDYALRQIALASLTVRQLGQTRVIEVLYSSPNPAFAADFLNVLSSEYIESNMEARWRMSERTGEWLTGQLDGMRVKLELSESALQRYAERSGLLFTGAPTGSSEKTNVSEDKLRQLQQQLSNAEADRAAAESRYEIAQSASSDTLADVLSDSNLRDLQSKLTDLRRQEADLAAVYTPKHEKVLRVDAQIQPLEAEVQRERAAIVSRIRNDYEAALRREKLLAADYAAQSQIVTDQAGKSIQYNILKRDVDSNRQIYESVLEEVKEASVASAIRASNIRVVDPAEPPHLPYSPNMRNNAIVGLISGSVFGIALILIRERANRTLQQPGEAQFWTNLPELGVIPSAKLESPRRIYGKVTPQAVEEAGKPAALLARDANLPVELITWSRKASVISEAFRNVLTSILFIGENGSRPKVLVLTSGSSGDGKTTAVSNLAIAAAEIRQKVLIIDADLRRPRVHDVFRVPNEHGLSTILRDDDISVAQAEEFVQPTSVPNLHVLTGGPATSGAAHLLYSPTLAQIVAKFRAEYDMIFIDTPPSLDLTDARVVGRLADAVVIVTRSGRTTKDVATVVSRRFSEDRTRVLGTILNDWNPNHSIKGYYGYYTGYYGRNDNPPSRPESE